MTNAFPNTLVNIAVWLVPVECLVQQVEVQTDLTSQEPQMVRHHPSKTVEGGIHCIIQYCSNHVPKKFDKAWEMTLVISTICNKQWQNNKMQI